MTNPDESPLATEPPRQKRYYRLNSLKVTFREYWNLTRSWQVIIPWTAKLLRLPMTFSSGMPSFESVRELKVPEEAFPAADRERLQPLLDLCLRMGFHSPQFHAYTTLRGETHTSFVALLHPSGAALRLMCVVAGNVHPPKVKLVAVLLSELSDGTFFFTSDQRPQFLLAPGIRANRLPGASLARLVDSHLGLLAQLAVRNPGRPMNSVEALDKVSDRYERLCRDFGMKRGIYVWMQPEELAGERKQLEEVEAEAGPEAENMEVLLELHKLQNKKTGWGAALVILLVSLGVFIGTGSRQWSWSFVLILAPVLFVHELGHYLAMRAFHYRNLRMFFIPFFGAAVTGRHYNVAGWKKVVVSLMGPVPGILLGAMLGGAGLALHNALLTKAALVALIVNGFNLLPVLPFDGGWVFHTVIFSRHYLLDSAFRTLAAGALAVAGLMSADKILLYLSLPMFASIPASYRLARISATLRKRGVEPASADAQTIPAQTAGEIIAEVKKSSQALQSNKLIAQQALQVFETLNARPPGWLASAGLLLAYLTSLGIAVVAASFLIVSQRGGLPALAANAAVQPKRNYVCGSDSPWRGARAAGAPAQEMITLIAHFPARNDAEQSLQSLSGRLPAAASASTLGESVLLELPATDAAARMEWMTELQLQSKQVIVESSNAPAQFSLWLDLPDESAAMQLEQELKEYFSANSTGSLIPPWHPNDPRTPGQRAAHQLARRTYLKAQARSLAACDDPGMLSQQKQLREALRRKDEPGAAALKTQIQSLHAALVKACMEDLKTGTEGPVDPAVLDLFAGSASLSANPAATLQKEQKLAALMGELPGGSGESDAMEGRFSAQSGFAVRQGRTLQLSWASFHRTGDGAPALLGWLCARGGSGFKYDILPETGLGTED